MTNSPPTDDRRPELPAPPRRILLFSVLALAAGIGAVRLSRGRGATEYVGRLQDYSVPVVTTRSGVVVELLAEEGEPVRIGDALLAVSNPQTTARRAEQRRLVASLEAELEQARARAELELEWRLKELNNDIFATRLQSAELLEEKYRHEMEKVALGDLLSSHSTALWSQSDTVFDSLVLQDPRPEEGRLNTVLRLESAINSVDVCAAQVDLCDDQVEWLEGLKESLPARVQQSFGVELADVRLREARAELQRLEEAADHEVLTSSAIGTVGVFRRRTGDYVKAGDILVEILDDARRSLVVDIPSADVDGFTRGCDVRLVFPGDKSRSGRVADIAPQTVPCSSEGSSSASGRVRVQIEPAGLAWPDAPAGTQIGVRLAE